MKKNILKQKALVSKVRAQEGEHTLLKLIVNNEILPLSIRENCANHLHSKAIKKTVRRVCRMTGRGRGVLIKERMSRLVFKKLTEKGLLCGLKKV